MKKLVIFCAAILFLSMQSCTHYYTPEKAANTGGKHCRRNNSVV